ncbi:MAG: tRNA (adenosine(37)-N6)-threonylcarbamoyltransferase complex transferase subunit TsaD, partial [Bacteroidota bacterium]
FAKAFALGRNIPLIDVHHLDAHIMAHFIEEENNPRPKPFFPFLCLTVSGGHTQIVVVEEGFKMKVIGRTLDDAAGEALDKAAKVIGLPYPGGPQIDKISVEGNAHAFVFPHPSTPGLDFSFSGLKTSFLYLVRDELKQNPQFIEEQKANLAASYQYAVTGYLVQKLSKASKQTGIREIALAGGVSANSALRTLLEKTAYQNNWKLHLPRHAFCTDNAAMIAVAGYFRYLEGHRASFDISAFSG